ncbi:MAG TPA: hypothetical protein VE398_13120, partial [Acidobacteriota bacterium]|nr:hypothetical protein [Acidobacteriota bacterium]
MFRRRIPLFVYCLLFLTVGMTTVRAQNQEQAVAQLPVNISSGQVTAAAGNETVRFSSLGLVRRMRLEVVNQVGARVFDSDFREGTFIDWKMEDSSRNRLADGLYGCHVTVEELSGHLSHRRGIFWLTAGNAYFTDPPGNRKSTQAADEVQESVTVLRADEGRAIALLAHDGNRGQVVSGKGGLSFRVGDFFSGKDIERMRLTEDGELGIGVEEPGARLDVAGLIRTSEGIVFPDGTIQKSAAGAGVVSASRDGSRAGAEGTVRGAATGGARSPGNAGSGKGNVILARDSGPGPVFAIDGSGTAGKIAKWTSSTLLGDSVLTESADGKIGIGTTTPISHFNVVSTSTSSPRGVTNEQYNNGMDAVQFRGRKARGAPASPAAVQAGDVLGNYVFDAHDGVAFYTGVQIRPVVEEAWTPTAHGAYLALWTTPPGTTTNTEKLRITGVGNVGIGTTTPTSKLTVAGDIESTTGFKIAGASVLGIPGTNNTFAGSGAGQNNTTGSENSFFGQGAGMSNTTGIKHSFFGRLAGMNNTGGIGN